MKRVAKSTGIYVKEYVEFEDTDSPEEIKNAFLAWGETPGCFELAKWLAFAEDRARRILHCHEMDQWPEKHGPDRTATVKDANELLGYLRHYHRAVERNDYETACAATYWIGRLHDTLFVRLHEPNAARGKIQLEGARRGHEDVHGSEQDKIRRWKRIYDRLQEHIADGMEDSAARKLTAKELGINLKQVYRVEVYKLNGRF